MDTKVGMVMRWFWMRVVRCMVPYFNLEQAYIIIFQSEFHSSSVSGHPVVLQGTPVVTTGNPVEVKNLHKNWFLMPKSEDG